MSDFWVSDHSTISRLEGNQSFWKTLNLSSSVKFILHSLLFPGLGLSITRRFLFFSTKYKLGEERKGTFSHIKKISNTGTRTHTHTHKTRFSSFSLFPWGPTLYECYCQGVTDACFPQKRCKGVRDLIFSYSDPYFDLSTSFPKNFQHFTLFITLTPPKHFLFLFPKVFFFQMLHFCINYILRNTFILQLTFQ